jgi:hypothetical protein
MRRIAKLSLLCLAAAGACKSADLVIPTAPLPYAGVRFINAVPDSAGTFGLDFRFVDQLESNAHFRINFRNNPTTSQPFISSQIQFKGANEGKRNFKIFLDDSVQAIASTVLKDTSVDLVKLHNYTAMMWGNGRSIVNGGTGPQPADAMHLTFWEEDVPDPGANVAMRVINTTNAAIDVRVYLTGGTVPVAPTFAAVPAYSKSAYVVMPPGKYLYNTRAAGAATNLIATDAQTLPGKDETCSGRTCGTGEHPDEEAEPGTSVAGSAVTGVVFPRSTAGARTPQTFTTPAITFMWDRRPPRSCAQPPKPYC